MARQQRLHVPPAVGNQINEDWLSGHSIDEPIRLEEGLAIFPDAQGPQFSRMRAAIGERGQASGHFEQPAQYVICFLRRIEFGDVVVELFQIALCALRDQDLVAHQPPFFFVRSRRTTSTTGLTFPSSISRLPSARIFSKARVSCVSS